MVVFIKTKEILFITILFTFIQSLLALNQLEFIHLVGNKIIFKNNNDVLRGSLYFTGDFEGFIEECVDCGGTKDM